MPAGYPRPLSELSTAPADPGPALPAGPPAAGSLVGLKKPHDLTLVGLPRSLVPGGAWLSSLSRSEDACAFALTGKARAA